MIDLKVLRTKERLEFSERAFAYLLSCRPGCEATIELVEHRASEEGLADKPPSSHIFTLVRTDKGFAVYDGGPPTDNVGQQERNALAPIANEKRSVL